MTLSQYMASTTPREHAAYVQWLSMQDDRPDRTDYYLMQVAYVVACCLSKTPGKFMDMRLRFGDEAYDSPAARRRRRVKMQLSKGYMRHRIEKEVQSARKEGKKVAIVERKVTKEEAMAEFNAAVDQIPTPAWMKEMAKNG